MTGYQRKNQGSVHEIAGRDCHASAEILQGGNLVSWARKTKLEGAGSLDGGGDQVSAGRGRGKGEAMGLGVGIAGVRMEEGLGMHCGISA